MNANVTNLNIVNRSTVPSTADDVWTIVGQSGVPVMHAALLPNGRVAFLDKVENYTQLTLPNGQYAYSAEWDPATRKCSMGWLAFRRRLGLDPDDIHQRYRYYY